MAKDTQNMQTPREEEKDPQQFGTSVPMPDLNPNAPKKPGPYDAPPRKTEPKKQKH